MGKQTTWRANVLICAIILLGFALTSYISYHSNREAFEQDAERVSVLTSEGIRRDIDAQFTRPIDVSLTMANDSLLKQYLAAEADRLDDPLYPESLRGYLDAYRVKYGYDSVFLASAASARYYHFNGIDRMLDDRGNPENDWFHAFLASNEEYALNVDNDEATDNAITVFVNARIEDADGGTLGIVGVGFRIDDLRALFASYEEQTGTRAYLVDGTGAIEVSTDGPDDGQENLFASGTLEALGGQVLGNREEPQSTWYAGAGGSGYLVSQYLPCLDWFLVVDHDTSDLDAQVARQFALAVIVIAIVIALVLLATTSIFRRCNALIAKQTSDAEKAHKTMFQEAAEQLYDHIYEIDVTRDRAANHETEQYLASLGVPPRTPYSAALPIIAERQIKEEFRRKYLDTFTPTSVLAAYERGEDALSYDFMTTDDGTTFTWMRANAHVFTWSEDGSVHMLVYRQNIDEEKRREHAMMEQMQRDPLTGLYNKAATQEHIRTRLAGAPGEPFAFLILDIDDFKLVNDRLGHSAGDTVLATFAQTVGSQFRRDDVVGRIGGDEFVAFLPVTDAGAAERKAAALVAALHLDVETDAGTCSLTASVGVALAPDSGCDFEALYRRADRALYRAKALGKSRYALDAAPDA